MVCNNIDSEIKFIKKTNTYNVRFINVNTNKYIGSISFGLFDKEALTIYSWKSEKGYGRKILNCLLNTLLKHKLINSNTSVEGMIDPIGKLNGNTYSQQYNYLNTLYRKLGFNINNGFFAQRVNKLEFDNTNKKIHIPSYRTHNVKRKLKF